MRARSAAGSSGGDPELGMGSPFRTFTWVAEYPFVTFFTDRMTFDIAKRGAGGASGKLYRRGRTTSAAEAGVQSSAGECGRLLAVDDGADAEDVWRWACDEDWEYDAAGIR